MSICAFKSDKPFTDKQDDYFESLEELEYAEMLEDYNDEVWDSAMSQAIEQGDYEEV